VLSVFENHGKIKKAKNAENEFLCLKLSIFEQKGRGREVQHFFTY
jgi:hypothetical protein